MSHVVLHSEFLTQLNDGWLTAHNYDMLRGWGADYPDAKVLRREIKRCGLTDEQVSAAYDEHRRQLALS